MAILRGISRVRTRLNSRVFRRRPPLDSKMAASSMLLKLFVAVTVYLLALSLTVEAAPTSDSANAYRILSSYMRQFNDPELDSAGYIIFDDKR